MKRIINIDKTGQAIKDLSKCQLPKELALDIIQALNPEIRLGEVKLNGAS